MRESRPPGGPRSRLFDRVAEGLRIAADPIIPCDDGDQLWRLADLSRRGQMNRIERSDWLAGIGPTGAYENGVGDAHDVAAAPKRPEPSKGGAFLLRADPAGEPRTEEAPCGLGESQCRGDPVATAGYGASRGRVLLKQGGKQRARLDISERHDVLATALGGSAAW